ncbi:MAG: indolepyruvate ferredoxin oxidoreductase subunit alpha [Chloroflexi bacterium]|nr:MAG: indolepyruvate ferredoxin oxidoreductase subunit alpha [Chloroflexota bacterium]
MIKMLSGNEAVARGAWEAGVVVAAAYPGTPSTEILENLARYPNIYAEWSSNEKVALDTAIGAAYAGKRAFAAMKHVGLNVAADSFMYASMTGMEAGLVIVSADDPAMHSSQNEQDNRTFAKFARIPCLEPSDSQEAKDMTIAAFGLSERFDTPVMLRLTTRICHSKSSVELGERVDPPPDGKVFPRNPAKYVMVPGNAVKRHPVIEQRMVDIALAAESFPYNRLEPGVGTLGIITAGVAYQYAKEVFPEAPVLRLGLTWPLPSQLIRKFAESVERIIIIEELDPFLEDNIHLMGIKVEGKSIFPITGELDPRVVRESSIRAGLLPVSAHVELPGIDPGPLPARPPVLCPGCPHRPTFYILNKLKVPVNGDIGCYTLGLIPPLSAIHTCGCMGASIGVAHGAVKAGSSERHVAVIGDSTFFHSGIPALVNTVYNNSAVTTIILDNRITGMTGHQENPGTGETLQGVKTTRVEIEPVVRALGIKHVQTVPAYHVEKIETVLKEYLKLDEPTVLIVQEPCALLPEARKRWTPLEVHSDKCNGCTLCFRIGCPAILKSEELDERYQRPKAIIDASLCTGCEVCAQICPRDAITFRQDSEFELA